MALGSPPASSREARLLATGHDRVPALCTSGYDDRRGAGQSFSSSEFCASLSLQSFQLSELLNMALEIFQWRTPEHPMRERCKAAAAGLAALLGDGKRGQLLVPT